MSQPNRHRHLRFESLEERRVMAIDAQMVADINPGTGASDSYIFTNVGGMMYFIADDGIHGRELWKSDGSAEGTSMIKDINPGHASSSPANLTNVNGTLFFAAYDGLNGEELWKSDGTAFGTVLVKDIYPGINDSVRANFTNTFVNFNGNLFFSAQNGDGFSVWKSDGTSTGTVVVKPGIEADSFSNINGAIYFRLTSNSQIWKSDGTTLGTNPFITNNIGSEYIWYKNAMFYDGSGVDGVELWKSDQTVAGTVQIKDLYPGFNNCGVCPSGTKNWGLPRSFKIVNDVLYFSARDATGYQLWKTDGTTTGTIRLTDQTGRLGDFPSYQQYGIEPFGLSEFNGKLFFSAATNLWQSDGTAVNTKPLDGHPFSGGPAQLVNFSGTLFFEANSSPTNEGSELWKSNGTIAGTCLVKDINSLGSSDPVNLTQIGNEVFFTADDGVHGRELWVLRESTLSATLTDTNKLFIVDTKGVYNNLTISREGDNLIIADANESFISAPNGGTLSNGGKTLTIPFATVNILDIRTQAGDDLVNIDTSSGQAINATIDLGSGKDRIDLVNNNTGNVWTFNGSQQGGVSIGSLGGVAFYGLENAQGGSGADQFIFAGKPGIVSVDGDFGSNDNSLVLPYLVNCTLSDTRLIVDKKYSVMLNHIQAAKSTLEPIRLAKPLFFDARLFSGNTLIYGGDGNDTIYGGSGNDTISGYFGKDLIIAGGGDDVIDDYGSSRIYGGDGNDTITGGDGNSVIDGGEGNDTIYDYRGDDKIYGGPGDDTILSGEGNDVINGGSGNDTITDQDGENKIYGESGDDKIISGGGVGFVDAGPGNDIVQSENLSNRTNVVFGGPGDDILQAFSGIYELHGGTGNDTLNVSLSAKSGLYGDAGDDTLISGDGNDFLFGGNGNDWLDGGGGNDLLYGGDGRDVLIGGTGADQLNSNDVKGTQTGDDLLIGGSIDIIHLGPTFMPAVRNAWTSNLSYADRILLLTTTGVGSKNFKLNFTTILDDNAIDILIGGYGADWYFAKKEGANKDTFTLEPNERVM